MGITWPLLLSLGFLLHSVSSQVNIQVTAAMTTAGPAAAGATPTAGPMTTAGPKTSAGATPTAGATPAAGAMTSANPEVTAAPTKTTNTASVEKIPTTSGLKPAFPLATTSASSVTGPTITQSSPKETISSHQTQATATQMPGSQVASSIVSTSLPTGNIATTHPSTSMNPTNGPTPSGEAATATVTPSDANSPRPHTITEVSRSSSEAEGLPAATSPNPVLTVTNKVVATTTMKMTTKTQEPKGNPTTETYHSIPSASDTPPLVTQVILTTKGRTTALPSVNTSTMTPSNTNSPTAPETKTFELSSNRNKEENKEFAEVCKRLLVNIDGGECTLKWQNIGNKVQITDVHLSGPVKTSMANQIYEELTKKPSDNRTLIAILASCGALLIMIVILTVCASHHRKPFNETQQHLTEELHTVENGYHDNPTLEVMEVQPEMQEKKVALNGEFNDSWIVPIDNLLKEDMPDEEDTHL